MRLNQSLNAWPAHTSTSTRIPRSFLLGLGKDSWLQSFLHTPSAGRPLINAFSCKNPSSPPFPCRRGSFFSSFSSSTKTFCLVSGSACPHLVLSSACTPLLPPLPPWA